MNSFSSFTIFSERIRRSIFIKLLLIFAATSLLATFAITYIMNAVQPSDQELRFRGKNRIFYANLLIDRMGISPNEESLKKIFNDLNIEIRIESPGLILASNASIPSWDFIQNHVHLKHSVSSHEWTGPWLSKIVISLEKGDRRYLFLFPQDPFLQLRPSLAGVLTGVILMLLLVTYLFTRWLFRPIKELFSGVEEVSLGHLNYRVEVNQSDELGDLAKSFNLMTSRIQKMLSAKEQLLLDVSHELRSPLTRIAVALEVGDKEDLIRQDLREMDTMLSEILESARLTSGQDLLKLRQVDICEILEELKNKYSDEAPGITLSKSDVSIVLEIDPSRMKTAFKNIIENAIKYSDKGRKPVEISISQTPEHIVVSIKDYGIGIAPDEQAHVFEAFYRVDRSRSKQINGYGLGLSLAKKIIEAHGGTISLESSLGSGTKIKVLLNLF